MLVLSRRENESIVIDGNIKIVVIGIQKGRVRLGIEAPHDMPVYRQELDNGLKRDTTDTTKPVYGSVDKKTRRSAWTVDAEKPVYEAGVSNLTKDDTSMMVHYANDRSVQATLYRIKQDAAQSKSGGEQK